LELAARLPEDFEFNVITNAIPTTLAASQNEAVHVIGGLLRPQLQELVGPKTIERIREISAQTVFLGASGLHLEKGITENHVFSAEVKKAMVDSAEKVILLRDSSKIGKASFTTIISFVEKLKSKGYLN
jgi:DeoR family fructose operon transcriptional repressor